MEFDDNMQWEDPMEDYDRWEQNQVDEDLRLERQAEEEAVQSVREVARQELLDDVRNVYDSLHQAVSFMRGDGNIIRGYEYVKQALDYLDHVEENARRLS